MHKIIRDVDPSYVSNINCSESFRDTSKQVFRLAGNRHSTVPEPEYSFKPYLSDINNHIDTNMFVNKCCVFFKNPKKCTVSPFIPEY